MQLNEEAFNRDSGFSLPGQLSYVHRRASDESLILTFLASLVRWSGILSAISEKCVGKAVDR